MIIDITAASYEDALNEALNNLEAENISGFDNDIVIVLRNTGNINRTITRDTAEVNAILYVNEPGDVIAQDVLN